MWNYRYIQLLDYLYYLYVFTDYSKISCQDLKAISSRFS